MSSLLCYLAMCILPLVVSKFTLQMEEVSCPEVIVFMYNIMQY